MSQDIANEQTYDSAFWTCLEKLRKYVVLLVNEVFGEHYTENADIIIKNNKHVVEETDGSLKQFYSDGYIELSDQVMKNNYNFECETWYDKGIAVRIDFASQSFRTREICNSPLESVTRYLFGI